MADLPIGTVRGRWLDGDGNPVVGMTVSFKPTTTPLQYVGSPPSTIAVLPRQATTDLDGLLAGPDGMTLLATDNDDVITADPAACFRWQVGYGGHEAAAALHGTQITVPTDGEVWLAAC